MIKFGLAGYPIADSLSPRLFDAAYHGNWPYELLESPDFETIVERFRTEDFRAINVTAPFKTLALGVSDVISEEASRCGAANILLRKDGRIEAHNSDLTALIAMIGLAKSVLVIGGGGAGKAAISAARIVGVEPSLRHHDELLEGPLEADVVVCTLPQYAPGLEHIRCRKLIEANYKTPCCDALPGIKEYIPGTTWLKLQALLGYELMTGEKPDVKAVMTTI